MIWTEKVAVLMVGVGAIFMFLSIVAAVALLPRLSQYYKKKWIVLTIFKGFFLLGYLAFIVIMAMNLSLPVEFVTGGVFLGGAFFVFMVIRVTKDTITDLTDKEAALNELNATLEKKVRLRTTELEKSMTDLAREVEERKIANMEIKRMGDELRQILDTISTGLRVINLDHTIVQVNKQFCNLTGLSSEELIGGFCYETFADRGCQKSPKCLLRTIQEHPDVSEQTVTRTTRDGREYQFHITSAPMRNSEGEIVGLLEDFQDITPLIKAQNRLHQAAKLESVGQLAAGIAHEINTPVQFVASNLDFLRESFEDISDFIESVKTAIKEDGAVSTLEHPLEESDWDFLEQEIPRALEQSQEGMGRVSKLVLAMKEFSHPVSREISPADINKMIKNTIMISRNEWNDVAELKVDLAEDLPQVPCLIDEMGQVVLNILVNAAHALADRKKGTGTIGVHTKNSGDCVDIIISDNGKGMDEDLLGRIFDPFFTTKEVGSGVGQGLSIANDIVVNKHHGEILVESEVGEGTTFTVRLPL